MKLLLNSLFFVVLLGTNFASFGQEPSNLFLDGDFQQGFSVVSANSGIRGILRFDPNSDDDSPFWTLAQHYSKFNILDSTLETDDDGREFKNEGKRVRLERNEKNETILQLDVDASREFEKTRQFNEPWPHLLISHDFPIKERLAVEKLQSLVFSLDVQIVDWENKATPDDYDPALHCAQTTAYFAISNDSPDSPDYRDYIWFGVPIFDSRYEAQEPYIELDGNPQILGTGKLIYTLGGKDVFDRIYDGENPRSGRWVRLKLNLLDYIPDALAQAQKRGLLTRTTLADLKLAHFNLGWEVPGAFFCSMKIKNLKLVPQFDKR